MERPRLTEIFSILLLSAITLFLEPLCSVTLIERIKSKLMTLSTETSKARVEELIQRTP